MLHSTQIDDDDESLGSVFSLSNGSSVSAGGGFSSTDPTTHQPPLLRTVGLLYIYWHTFIDFLMVHFLQSTMNADSSAPARGAIGTPSRPNVAESALARTPNPNEFDTTMRTPSSSTPRRNASRSNESSSYSGTPSSRFGRLRNTPRINPFESTAIDRLKFPTMSPSIFNTVQSPSQEVLV